MGHTLKAFLWSLPLAVGMYFVTIFVGFYLWGSEWSMAGVPAVSLITGFVSFRIVKAYFEKRGKSE